MIRAILVVAFCQLVLGQYGQRYSSNGYQRYDGFNQQDSRDAYRKIGSIVRNSSASWNAGEYSIPLSHFRTGLMMSPSAGQQHLVNKVPIGILAVAEDIDLPESFDARTKWPECNSIKEIRNQGCCGSCYAVSAASTMSDRWCIHSPAKESFTFGSYDLISCCPSCGNGCNGGDLPPVWKYWVERGITSGGAYGSRQGCHSYPITECHSADEDESAPRCSRKCQTGYNETEASHDRRFGRLFYAIPNEEERIMEELYYNGPVQAAFDVFVDFKTYKSGIYRHVWGPKDGGHAVKIIGWGVENVKGQPVKYWLVANSWGEEWGENGFFRMVRGENHCGIESYVFSGLPHFHKHNELEGYNF